MKDDLPSKFSSRNELRIRRARRYVAQDDEAKRNAKKWKVADKHGRYFSPRRKKNGTS